MSTILEDYLATWPKPYIRDHDLDPLYHMERLKRHDAVKYALKKKRLLKIRRGLYLINLPGVKVKTDLFELANIVMGPSYVSLESALSFYGWIPEAVPTITSVTPKRKKTFVSEIAKFTYDHVPSENFFEDVHRVETKDGVYLIADAWRALADCIYVYKKEWGSLEDLEHDYRIEREDLLQSDLTQLHRIAHYYKSYRVRSCLRNFYRELCQ